MKILKHGNRYQITYRCPKYPKAISEYFDTQEEAELRRAQINLEKKRGTLVPPAHLVDPDANLALTRATMTVEQLMKIYVDRYGCTKWSDNYMACNLHRIEDYIIPYIGDWRIKDITTHKLEAFYQELQAKPAVRMKGHRDAEKTVSLSVIEKVHAIIRSALNQAIRWDFLRGANPAMTVFLPKQEKKERAVWSPSDYKRALKVCENQVLKLCLMLAMACSMRIGEILGLT